VDVGVVAGDDVGVQVGGGAGDDGVGDVAGGGSAHEFAGGVGLLFGQRDRVENIDHRVGEPVLSQLAGILRRHIERGDVAPGKPLPPIAGLMQTYGVSDGTVKRALSTLRDEGLVDTVSGRGYYVTERT
jgi:GntR family transcriptional regulator